MVAPNPSSGDNFTETENYDEVRLSERGCTVQPKRAGDPSTPSHVSRRLAIEREHYFTTGFDGTGMKRLRAVGAIVTALGIGGYIVGVAIAYTGRAFAVTVVMVGLTLLAIGGSE